MEFITITEIVADLIKRSLAFVAGTVVKQIEPETIIDDNFFDFIEIFAETEFENFCKCENIVKVVEG